MDCLINPELFINGNYLKEILTGSNNNQPALY